MSDEATTPWYYGLDFKIDRSFNIASLPFNIYLYVQNALNQKNVQHVYLHTGTTTSDGSHTPNVREVLIENMGEAFINLYNLINHDHRQHYQITNGSDLFGQPREIRLGLQIGFGAEN